MTSATDSRTNELLPCPFCGGEAQTTLRNIGDSGEDFWSVECFDPECGCDFCLYHTEAEAIAAWNTRAHGTLTAEQVEDAVYRHTEFYEGGDVDVQAIADELNARAERTCKAIRDKSNTIVCSKCGGGGLTIPNKGQGALRNYCPNCGAKVVSK